MYQPRIFRTITFTVLRVTAGVILAAHGWQKLTGLEAWQQQLSGLGVAAPEVMSYLAIAGEFLGGLGLVVGLLTPLAAFGTACIASAAIVLVHWGNGLFAQNGGFEFPLALLTVSLLFIAHGGGDWSLDAAFKRAKRMKAERQPRPRHEQAKPNQEQWERESHAPGY